MNYIWDLPTKVLFGQGMLNELHNEEMPGKKALIVISNGQSIKNNGWIDEVVDELEQAEIDGVIYDNISSNPTDAEIMEAVACARENDVDFIVGLGGGSVLGAVTVIAAMTPQDSDNVWDYVDMGTGGCQELKEKPLPYIAIPTTSSTGSEVNKYGVITNQETSERVRFEGEHAYLAIVDTRLMLTVPSKYTAYQGFISLLQGLEAYVSTERTAPAQMMGITILGNIAQCLPTIVKDGNNIDAREMVAFASTLSGYATELSSSTGEYALANALCSSHPELPYGVALIMVSLAYFKHFIDKHVCDDRFIEMAMALGARQVKGPYDFLQALERLMKACGVSDLKMSEYSISPSEFPTIVKKARESMGDLFEYDPESLTDEEIESIYLDSYR